MYKREKAPACMKGSTSALCNNLSVHVNNEKGLITYAVVHKSVVNLFTSTLDGTNPTHRQISCKEPSATQGATMILQAKLIPMPRRTILVVTSQKGIQMFEADSSNLLFWYALGDVDSPEIEACFGRGICGVQPDTICVGTHEGDILVFDIPGKGTNITMCESLKGHRGAICDLASDKDMVVSGDQLGNIILWQAGESFRQIARISGSPGSPCSSLALWDEVIVAGYGTGHLRLFSTATGRISAEATAHARWINAIDVTPKTGRVITVSEDSFVRVWQIHKSANIELEHLFGVSVTDVQLQGVQFTNRDGRSFCATGYDNNELYMYSQS